MRQGETSEEHKSTERWSRLLDLLTGLFSEAELKQLIGRYYPEIGKATPAGGSLNDTAYAFVTALERRGESDDEFFMRLRELRPNLIVDIDVVQRAWPPSA